MPARLARHIWAPHEATILIAINFVIMFVAVGAWAYTDLLRDLANGVVSGLDGRLILFALLLAGALLGGYTAGLLKIDPISPGSLARCFLGGLLMGWGSLLIPGGNDGLLLIGLPLFWLNAWIGILTMGLTIYVALMLKKVVGRALGGGETI